MEGFGVDKLVLILIIVLVLFGARRIPEIGASIGKGIREFKRGMNDLHKEPDDAPTGQLNAGAPLAATEQADDERPAPKRLLRG